MNIRLKLYKYMLKRRMRKKVKKAFEPYHKGEKTFLECQCGALTDLLGSPAIEPIDSEYEISAL